MSELQVSLRLSADGKQLQGELRKATGETVKFSENLEGGAKRGTRALRDTERQTRRVSDTTARATRRVAALLAGYISLQSANRLLRSITANTIRQEAAIAQLEAAIASTGGAAGRTVAQLKSLSSELQRLTNFGDEAIQEMQAVLLTFTKIQDVQFDRATVAILDMSTRLGTDLRAAAQQVGRALQDPIQGVTALQRAGVLLNDQQREQIRLMVEAGDVAAAQRIIMAELETQFGGAAEAARGTFGGALQALKNALGDMLEFRGDLPELAAAIEAIIERISDPALAQSIQAGLGAVLELLPVAIDLAVTALKPLVGGVQLLADNSNKLRAIALTLASVLIARLVASLVATTVAKQAAIFESIRYQAALARMAGLSQTAAASQLVLTAAVRGVSGVLRLVGGPAGLAFLAGTGLLFFATRARAAGIDTDDLRDRISLLLGEFEKFTLKEMQQALADTQEKISDLADEIDQLEQKRRAAEAGRTIPLGTEAFGPGPGVVFTDEEARRLAELREEQEELTASAAELGVAMSQLGADAATAAGGINEAAGAAQELTDPLEKLVAQLTEQLITLRDGQSALLDHREALALAAAAERDAADGTTANTEAVRRLFGEIRRLRGEITAEEARQKAATKAREAEERAAENLVKVYQDLRAEVEPLAVEQERLTGQIELLEAALELSEEELSKLGLTATTVRRLLAHLRDEMGKLGQVDTQPAERFLENLQAQLAALEGGPEAMREWRREQVVLNNIKAAGIDLDKDLTEEQQRLAEAIRAVTLAIEDQTEAMQRNQQFGRFASNFASAIIEGADLGDALGRSLRATGGEQIAQGVQDAIVKALGDIDLDSPEAAAVMLSLGQAVGGNMGAAIGTALGAAIGSVIPGVGTALGATIGGFLGGLIGGSDPKFQIGGMARVRAGSIAGGTPRGTFDTALGEFGFRFRKIEDETAEEMKVGIQGFFAALAGAMPREFNAAAEAALRDFEFDSKDHGESLRQLLQAMFDTVVDTLGAGVQAVVRRGHSLEDQLQRLADVFAIRTDIFLGGGLGLTGSGIAAPLPPGPPGPPMPPGPPGDDDPRHPRVRIQSSEIAAFNSVIQGTGDAAAITNPVLLQTLELVDELRRPNESLLDTYNRLLIGIQAIDTGLMLIGNAFAGSRAEMIRFADELLEVFGDDAGRLSAGLNRIFETFFSDDELAQVAADQARQRARDLFEALGIEFSEALLSEGGFRELFEELFGMLDPADTALLIQAGGAVADFIEAMERLEPTLADNTEALADFIEGIARQLEEVDLTRAELEFLRYTRALESNLATLIELGASEEHVALVRRLHQRQLEELAFRLEESAQAIADQLLGAPQQIERIGRAQDQVNRERLEQLRRERQALIAIQAFLDSVLLSAVSPLTPEQRLAEAERQFESALAAARSGDIDAKTELPSLFETLLREASTFWGTASEPFRDLFDRGIASLEEFGPPGPEVRPPTQAQVGAIQDSARGIELSAAQQLRLASELVAKIALLSRIGEETPVEIATRLGYPLADLIQAITGELPDLTGDALEEYFDDLVREAGSTLDSSLAQLDVAEDQLDVLIDMRKLLQQINGTFDDDPERLGLGRTGRTGQMQSFQDGGPVFHTGPAVVHSGEWVVPQGGALVRNDPAMLRTMERMRDRLEAIESRLETGNTDRRDGVRAQLDGQAATVSELARLREMASREPLPVRARERLA